jgi:1-acyl-sn-glycerol-3-phosphate acyltransferase
MRSLSASLIPALNGTALIAQRTGAPILPIGIWGTEKMKGVWWYFTRPAIEIRFGKPFNIPPETSKQGRGVGTHLIMEHIAELLPPEYRGAYAIEGPTVCK